MYVLLEVVDGSRKSGDVDGYHCVNVRQSACHFPDFLKHYMMRCGKR
jgi:hypothetical protein